MTTRTGPVVCPSSTSLWYSTTQPLIPPKCPWLVLVLPKPLWPCYSGKLLASPFLDEILEFLSKARGGVLSIRYATEEIVLSGTFARQLSSLLEHKLFGSRDSMSVLSCSRNPLGLLQGLALGRNSAGFTQ